MKKLAMVLISLLLSVYVFTACGAGGNGGSGSDASSAASIMFLPLADCGGASCF